jgi:hypothetical protein
MAGNHACLKYPTSVSTTVALRCPTFLRLNWFKKDSHLLISCPQTMVKSLKLHRCVLEVVHMPNEKPQGYGIFRVTSDPLAKPLGFAYSC